MAKSRAQRKAEQRRKREQQLAERARRTQAEAQAQHDTQAPESGVQAEMELEMQIAGERAAQGAEAPEAPAPSRADVGAGEEAPPAISRRERKRLEREREERARESAERRQPKEAPAERRRGIVRRFLGQVVRELSRVQWPDRETLIQASTVTLIFVAICAAYLGVLDAIFSRLVDMII